MNKKSNDGQGEIKVKGKGRLRVNFWQGGRLQGAKRFVHANGIISGDALAAEVDLDAETIRHLMVGVRRILRAGYEVRLNVGKDSGVRIYHCLGVDGKMRLASQVFGNFRDSVNDLDYESMRGGETIDNAAAQEFTRTTFREAASKRAFVQGVTPDTMVTCPECGAEFRVGKVLT